MFQCRHLIIIPVLLALFTGTAKGVEPHALAQAYHDYAMPLRSAADLTPLFDRAQDKRLVLLGEASHGTREFYTWRAEISQHLITQGDISFVAVEGDWTVLAPINDYVRHEPGAAQSAHEALMINERWPRWMWANEEFATFVEWLRDFNKARRPENRVGIYGMDVYSSWDAMDTVMDWYETQRADKAEAVREFYAPLAPYRDNPHGYARAARAEQAQDGVSTVAEKTHALWQQAENEQRRQAFFINQAAHIAKRAEAFYRLSSRHGPDAWNARATHMHETVTRLLDFYGAGSRGIVWAHNTHIGDAQATAMVNRGEHNIGQLSRTLHGPNNVLLVGFTTYTGAVHASRQWGAPRQSMNVPKPPPQSFEAVLKTLGLGDAYLLFPPSGNLPQSLTHVIGHRAIGVIYDPARDHLQYVPTIPALRYDALLFLENTTTLTPLHDN